MPRMEDILNLPVQDPPCAEFSAAHINWVKLEGGRQGGDDIALIPFVRVDGFVKGESSNPECPASFRVESRRKRPEGSVTKPRVDGYLEYTLYWCSYGPEDYREGDSCIGDSKSTKPASGKGSRPGRRHMMRGCLCHFTVKRLYTRPLLALIIYNQRRHVDKTGAPCHGILDRDAIGTRAMYAPRISDELRQKVMSMLYVGISLDNIIQHHVEVMQKQGGPQNRDDFLTRNDVRNMERSIRNSSHELQENDECSVKIWVQRHPKHVFYYQDNSGSQSFVLGIQTDWQLQQMIRYGNKSFISFHSTFGLKKLKYPVCSLLVFGSSQNAIPVAWIITSSFVRKDIHKWIALLSEKIRAKDPRWRPSAVILDDPSFDYNSIREAFQCRILLCAWHVRRSWIKKLFKTCCNFEVQREMLRHLGWILYCTRCGPNAMDALEEFMQIFVDQCSFMEYFKSKWLPSIDMWINGIKSLPLTMPESLAAIESYHIKLKSTLLKENNANFWPRLDWLIHTLTTGFLSLYWLDQYSLDTGYFANLQDKSLSANAWYHALNIPDVDVILDEQNLRHAKVLSQTDRNLVYTVWNPGSEFSLCDCSWSRLGNLCKHVIKVATFCRSRQVTRPLLSAQVYKQALLTLLHNPPDDPLVLDHTVLHVARLQQDIKALEELSNSGLLQPLASDLSSQMAVNPLLFQHLH
ncbi:uncharacterized protein LOC130946573 isoform X1 [Arachis stenosperma]|uniref:uncharacterized protein LOC130946573 isoform X1 n=1 Tax=Arachis stenosperma TaxID=217475 RepID=UPI0025AD4194|nr:uncharacterized protein LOC130946573 isoform X1 [Arachis stenosperma]XP_057731341.1 uncharacterized protein LOC130946573 isoform X1 [Arachis stenosperma]XP_057731342.1 uncharacterized protein LOC130946573 isoform X1 [Arachis stenosperma]XP_057731343.1 uncharacterized protein LOC130946573 isoform X1 [Arachis stenosperma]